MRLAELAGPSGVGKSAIYREVVASGEVTPNPKPSFAEALEATRGHVFACLIERIAKTAKGPRVEARRSFLYRSLYKDFLAGPVGKPMLVDGGLIQRGLAVEQLLSDVPMSEFWRDVPLPDVLFLVSADRDTILSRNKARGGDHDRSWQADLAIKHFSKAHDALQARGCRVVCLNAERPVEHNVGLVLKELA